VLLRYGNATTIDPARINICGASRNYNANCTGVQTSYFNGQVLNLNTQCQNYFLQQAAGQQVSLWSLCQCYVAMGSDVTSQVPCRPYNGLGNTPVATAYEICVNNPGMWTYSPTQAAPTLAPTQPPANAGATGGGSSSSGGGTVMWIVIVAVVAIIAVAVVLIVMKKKKGAAAADPREAFQNPMCETSPCFLIGFLFSRLQCDAICSPLSPGGR